MQMLTDLRKERLAVAGPDAESPAAILPVSGRHQSVQDVSAAVLPLPPPGYLGRASFRSRARRIRSFSV